MTEENEHDSPATTKDYIDRIYYQFDRYLELRRMGELTPQYRKFGKKHVEDINARARQILIEVGEPSRFSQGKER